MKTIQELQELRELTRQRVDLDMKDHSMRIAVCMGTCGIASGGDDVYQTFLKLKEDAHLDELDVIKTGCIGVCKFDPIVEVYIANQKKVTYIEIDDDVAKEIFEKHILNDEVLYDYTIGKYFEGEDL